jgi:hypothetical protein
MQWQLVGHSFPTGAAIALVDGQHSTALSGWMIDRHRRPGGPKRRAGILSAADVPAQGSTTDDHRRKRADWPRSSEGWTMDVINKPTRRYKAADDVMLCGISGALAGSAILPGIGTLIGGIVGAAAGPLGSKSTSAMETKNERRKRVQYWHAHLHDDGQLAL